MIEKLSSQYKRLLDTLKALGYVCITTEKAATYRRNPQSALLKDILKFKLVAINSYIYNGQELKFNYQNINKAINDIDLPVIQGMETKRQEIRETLVEGRCYEDIRIDETTGSYHLIYFDRVNPECNEFHLVQGYLLEKADGTGEMALDVVLFVNGIPLGIILGSGGELHKLPQIMKFSPEVLLLNQQSDDDVLQEVGRRFHPVSIVNNIK